MSDHSPVFPDARKSASEVAAILAMILLLLGQMAMAGATLGQVVEEVRLIQAGSAPA